MDKRIKEKKERIFGEIKRITENPTEEDFKPLRKMYRDLDLGLPQASGITRNSRCVW